MMTNKRLRRFTYVFKTQVLRLRALYTTPPAFAFCHLEVLQLISLIFICTMRQLYTSLILTSFWERRPPSVPRLVQTYSLLKFTYLDVSVHLNFHPQNLAYFLPTSLFPHWLLIIHYLFKHNLSFLFHLKTLHTPLHQRLTPRIHRTLLTYIIHTRIFTLFTLKATHPCPT